MQKKAIGARAGSPNLILNFGTFSYLRNGWNYRLEIVRANRVMGVLTKTMQQ